MPEDKKSINSQAEDIRKELDDLIGDNDTIQDVIETDPELPPKRNLPTLPTYGELKISSSNKAKKTITSLMKFYKKKIDEMTMGSLIYQLQAGERALTTLLEAIEDGEVAPRMFEVLATLQKSMLDIIKSQTMYLMAAEEGAKRIARDIEIYKKRDDVREIDESTPSGRNSNDNVQRGTKDIMRMIQDGIQDVNIEDVEITEE